MCTVCDKVTFAIDTLEKLFPIEDLLPIFAESFKVPEDKLAEFKANEVLACHANFVCLLTLRYCIKQNVSLPHLVQLFTALAAGEEGRRNIERLYKEMTGLDLNSHHDQMIPRRLEDYMS